MKHKILIIPLLMLFLLRFSAAQEYSSMSPEWLINSSGEKWDVVCDMVAGNDSSFYLAGNYTASSKIKDKTTTLTGENNSFVIKLDKGGNELWQTHLISTGYSNITSLSCDGEGAIYACGTFKGGLNVGIASVETGDFKSLFILKLGKNGEVATLQQIAGNFSNNHIAIATNSRNELLLAVSFKGSLKIDNRKYTSLYYYDILIAKIDNKGKIKDVKILYGKGDDLVNDIACTVEDDIYITGSFERDLFFGDKVIKTTGDSDGFLIKINDKFEFVYGKQIGGIYDDYGKSISTDNKDNILLVGCFGGELPLSDGYNLTSNGILDVFLLKLDENGNLLWADSFGGGANDYVSSMALSPSGNIYIDGTYRGTIEKENFEIESSEFSNDIFIAKYNEKGEFRFLENAGDAGVDFGRKLISSTDGYIYLSGDFSNSFKIIDKETEDAADDDYFIARLYDCEESIEVQLPADTSLCAVQYIISAGEDFTEYFWNGQPGGYELTIDSTGVYSVEVVDEHGCMSSDSITINLFTPPVIDLGDTIFALKGEIITIEAPVGMEDYLWNDGSTFSFIDVNTGLLEAGNYNYSVEIEDENNCVAEDDIALVVLDDGMIADNMPFKDYSEDTFPGDVENGNREISVRVYPNPAKEKIYIEIIYNKPNVKLSGSIELFTSKSELLLTKNVESKVNKAIISISLGNIEPGNYYLWIKINHQTFFNKLIVL